MQHFSYLGCSLPIVWDHEGKKFECNLINIFVPLYSTPLTQVRNYGALIENLAKKGRKTPSKYRFTVSNLCLVLHSRLIIYEEGKLPNVVQRRIDVNDSVTILALDCYIKSSHLVSENAFFACRIGTAERTTITIHRTKHIRPGYHEYNQKGK